MRLICPNCGAQYEVDDSVIPEQGRDVQCSNCGHTWYQRPGHLQDELSEETQDGDVAGAGSEGPGSLPIVEAGDETPAGAVPQRRGLDPEVAGVLREEAEREAAVRRAEADGLETQPDLGLEDTPAAEAERSAAARARMARLRGMEDTPTEAEVTLAGLAAAAENQSGRDLLPDIDEINTSLTAAEDREELGSDGITTPGQERSRRNGFRVGFWLVVILVAGMIALYALAPRIVVAFPEAEPWLLDYVNWANTIRADINASIDAGTAWVRAFVQDFMG